MQWQLNALSNCGLISKFVGMLTDSRSFMSYPRHEYFRRILCDMFGRDIESGEMPPKISRAPGNDDLMRLLHCPILSALRVTLAAIASSGFCFRTSSADARAPA